MPDNIVLEDVSIAFGTVRLLRKTCLHISSGAAIGITGRGGCGKSTFLEICAGLTRPGTGKVLWDDLDLCSLAYRELLFQRRSVGFVFQQRALISAFTVFDNIALPLRYNTSLTDKEIAAKVKEQMEELGIFDLDRAFPEVLSVSQATAVALARALVTAPQALFLDEPFAGLDTVALGGVVNVLRSHRQNRSMLMLVTSSSVEPMKQLGCTVYVLDSGTLRDCNDDSKNAQMEFQQC